jgi:polyphosphate glucokinase
MQMRVLVVDIGGTNVKILATGEQEPRKFPSGRKLTPEHMVAGVRELAGPWKYDAVALGYPGQVHDNRIVTEPKNLAHGWAQFDFQTAFGCPVRIMNDAAMQALGSYKSGLLLFLGLGTGLGSALVRDGLIVPLELGGLAFKDRTYEDYLGVRGLKRLGRKRWQKYVEFSATRMIQAVLPDDVVLGGGNAKKLTKLPKGCRLGSNAFAFIGGYRMWEDASKPRPTARARPVKRAAARGYLQEAAR